MAKVEGDQLELYFPTCRDEETQGVILKFYGITGPEEANWDTFPFAVEERPQGEE